MEAPIVRKADSIEEMYDWFSTHEEVVPDMSEVVALRLKDYDIVAVRDIAHDYGAEDRRLVGLYLSGGSEESLALWCGTDWQRRVQELSGWWPKRGHIMGGVAIRAGTLPALKLGEASARRVLPGTAEDWDGQMLCQQVDPLLFDSCIEGGPNSRRHTNEAKKICGRCEVLDNCRECVMRLSKSDQPKGVVGGLSWSERVRLKRQVEAVSVAE